MARTTLKDTCYPCPPISNPNKLIGPPNWAFVSNLGWVDISQPPGIGSHSRDLCTLVQIHTSKRQWRAIVLPGSRCLGTGSMLGWATGRLALPQLPLSKPHQREVQWITKDPDICSCLCLLWSDPHTRLGTQAPYFPPSRIGLTWNFETTEGSWGVMGPAWL